MGIASAWIVSTFSGVWILLLDLVGIGVLSRHILLFLINEHLVIFKIWFYNRVLMQRYSRGAINKGLLWWLDVNTCSFFVWLKIRASFVNHWLLSWTHGRVVLHVFHLLLECSWSLLVLHIWKKLDFANSFSWIYFINILYRLLVWLLWHILNFCWCTLSLLFLLFFRSDLSVNILQLNHRCLL